MRTSGLKIMADFLWLKFDVYLRDCINLSDYTTSVYLLNIALNFKIKLENDCFYFIFVVSLVFIQYLVFSLLMLIWVMVTIWLP
jgi:hypothetical protein